jgi:hypothetical protein
MKRIFKKLIAGSLLVVMVTVSGLITLTIFPQSLFAHEIKHEKFRVYSDQVVDKTEIKPILDNAYSLIAQSELFDPEYEFNIFLAFGNIFNKIEDLQGRGPSARATAGNIIIKVPIDIENNLAFSSVSRINLTELIAHEMVHNLQANRYGLWNFSPIKHPPLWKLEGYPEYISRRNLREDSSYNLMSEIKRCREIEISGDYFIEVVKNHFMPSYYYKGRIMVEYLIDIKGFTYDQILNDTRSEEEVFHEIVQWMDERGQNDHNNQY